MHTVSEQKKHRRNASKSPVLAVVSKVLSLDKKGKLKPQDWLFHLFTGVHLTLQGAAVHLDLYAGSLNCVLLRDELGAEGVEPQAITRFHTARKFINASIELSTKRLSINRDNNALKKNLFYRTRLLNWLDETESLYRQHHQSQINRSGPSSLSTDAEAPAEVSSQEVVGSNIELSNLSDSDKVFVRKRLLSFFRDTQSTNPTYPRMLLTFFRFLAKQLIHREPAATYLCRRIFAARENFTSLTQTIFSLISESNINHRERSWLSELGSFIIELDQIERQRLAKTNQKKLLIDDSNSDPVLDLNDGSPMIDGVDERVNLDEDSEQLRDEVEMPDLAQSSDNVVAKVTKKTYVQRNKNNLGPQIRRRIKELMEAYFAEWQNADNVQTEKLSLCRLASLIKTHAKYENEDSNIEQLLLADSFYEAQLNIEKQLDESVDQRSISSYLNNLVGLCQEVQSNYVDHLKTIMSLSVFSDLSDRKKFIDELLQFCKTAFENIQGSTIKRWEKAEATTCAQCVTQLSLLKLSESGDAFLEKCLSHATGFIELRHYLRQFQSLDPIVQLLRSEMKGLVEDIAISCAFDRSEKQGWDRFIKIIEHQRPLSESELVAIIARKIDAFSVTSAHINFLNPTKCLRLNNFLSWIQCGYALSPQFSNSLEERELLFCIEWLVEQFSTMQIADADHPSANNSMDCFIKEEASNNFQIYAAYVQQISIRFTPFWDELQRQKLVKK